MRAKKGNKGGAYERTRGALVRKRAVSFDPKVFLAKVGEGKTIFKYRKDQVVFSQGQVADAVFYIQQGKIKLTVVSEQGKEAVVAVLGPGHFFGEGCLNGHPLRIATTRAMDECVVTRLEKATMVATKRRHGLDRCRYKGDAGMKRWVGLGVIADTIINIGRALEKRAAREIRPALTIRLCTTPAGHPRRVLRCSAPLITLPKTSILRRKVAKRTAPQFMGRIEVTD